MSKPSSPVSSLAVTEYRLGLLRLIRDLNKDLLDAGVSGPYGPSSTSQAVIANASELIVLARAGIESIKHV